MRIRWRALIVAATFGILTIAPLGSGGVASAATVRIVGCPAPIAARARAAAHAAIYPPSGTTLAVSISIVTPGGTITITGRGFFPGSTITIYLCSQVTQVGTATAGSDGSFSATVSIPGSTPPGTHELAAVGTSASGGPLVQVADITVAGASPVAQGQGNQGNQGQAGSQGNQGGAQGQAGHGAQSNGQVAFTGIYAVPMILVALALVLSGSALVLIARRRRLMGVRRRRLA